MKYTELNKKINELLEDVKDTYEKEPDNNKYVNLCYNSIITDLESMIGFFKAQEFKEKNNFKFYNNDINNDM